MHKLINIKSSEDILPEYKNTPIELLLEYHNLNRKFDTYKQAQILIGMCMDNRIRLNIPDNFAFVIRDGGANLKYSEFKISYALAVGGVKYIALIAHSNCGMVNLVSRKDKFIDGLVKNAGWKKELAEEHFINFSSEFEIGNEIEFIVSETKRLRLMYPKITIVPMLYKVEDNKLYLINEK